MSANLTDHAAVRGTATDTIERLLACGSAQLAARGSSARLEAELLLAQLLGKPRSHLIVRPERVVPIAAAATYGTLLARAARGEPLAYLTGEREFWSLPLSVTPAVLIPRPETELAVERCLAAGDAMAASGDESCRLCDLGTGSGAIALALAVERPAWQITATDRSDAALQVARTNAGRLDLQRIEFLQGNWFEPLGARCFDVLVANPPYIAASDPALSALRYEPLQALTPGPTGLEALSEIVARAPAHLAAGGWLVLEHGADQAAAVARTLRARGYARIASHRDLSGHDRVTEGQWDPDRTRTIGEQL